MWKANIFGDFREESCVAAVRLSPSETTIQDERRVFFLEQEIELHTAVKLSSETYRFLLLIVLSILILEHSVYDTILGLDTQ